MKINWKIRLQSYPFWVALLALVGLLVTDLGVIEIEQYETYVDAVLMVIVALGITADPTTQGVQDSTQALTYDKPKQKDVL